MLIGLKICKVGYMFVTFLISKSEIKIILIRNNYPKNANSTQIEPEKTGDFYQNIVSGLNRLFIRPQYIAG